MPAIASTVAAVIAVCGIAGLACGCGSSPASRTAPAPSAPASLPAVNTGSPMGLMDPRARILAAYAGMWQAFAAAARTADYQPGPLQPYAAGEALSVLTRVLYQGTDLLYRV